jgi:hypothetical protein
MLAITEERTHSAPTYAWYAIHTKRREIRAQENLNREGYRVFLPALQSESLKDGARTLFIRCGI